MIAKINFLQPVGFLLVRLLIGLAMIAHGYPKLFASEQFLVRFPQMGFPAWSVYLAGSVEVFGGALLVLGLFARYAAFLISGQMFAAFLNGPLEIRRERLPGISGEKPRRVPPAAVRSGLPAVYCRGGETFFGLINL